MFQGLTPCKGIKKISRTKPTVEKWRSCDVLTALIHPEAEDDYLYNAEILLLIL